MLEVISDGPVVFQAAKAAVINFYETLRFEVRDDVGITIASHGWVGDDSNRRNFMLEEGTEIHWKEEREVSLEKKRRRKKKKRRSHSVGKFTCVSFWS